MFGAALQSFSTRALALDVKPIYGRTKPKPGVAYFFSRPSSGGACKRLNLFLRWMVREDQRRSRRVVEGAARPVDRAARHARDSRRSVPAPDHAQESRLADGRRHHRVAARDRSGRSRQVRLLDLPPRHDERLRIREGHGRCALPAQGRLSSRRRRERRPAADYVEHRDEPLHLAWARSAWPPPDRQAAHPLRHHHPGAGHRHLPGDDGIHVPGRAGQQHAAVSGRRAVRAALRASTATAAGSISTSTRYHAFRDRATTFEHVGAVGRPAVHARRTAPAKSSRFAARCITPRSMRWLDAAPVAGRTLIPADGDTGAERVVADSREPVAPPLRRRSRRWSAADHDRRPAAHRRRRHARHVRVSRTPASCGCRSTS